MDGGRLAVAWPLFATAAIVFQIGQVIAEDVTLNPMEIGKQQFQTSCGTCHTAEEGTGNRQGPNLHSVYGRKVGTAPDYHYSDTLKSGDWIWTEVTLDPWLTNSQKAHPGTFMNYRQASADKRQTVIAYLKSLSKKVE